MVIRHMKEEDLDKTLTRLIANDLGVMQSEVTVEYIHKLREENPTTAVDFTNKYGGLTSKSDSFFSEASISRLRESGECFMAEFRRKKQLE
jgi:hypothetical protein